MLLVEAGLASAPSPFSLCVNAESWCCWLFPLPRPPLGTHTCEGLGIVTAQWQKKGLLRFLVSLDIREKQTLVLPTVNSEVAHGSHHTRVVPPQPRSLCSCGDVETCCSPALLSASSAPAVAFSWFRSPSECVSDSSSSRFKGWT